MELGKLEIIIMWNQNQIRYEGDLKSVDWLTRHLKNCELLSANPYHKHGIVLKRAVAEWKEPEE